MDEASSLGLKVLYGNLSVFYQIKDGKFAGVIGVHVDDLINFIMK